ncbi:hypothetical protein GGH92_009314, partial [Coemansia sp. RSA 2673]
MLSFPALAVWRGWVSPASAQSVHSALAARLSARNTDTFSHGSDYASDPAHSTSGMSSRKSDSNDTLEDVAAAGNLSLPADSSNTLCGQSRCCLEPECEPIPPLGGSVPPSPSQIQESSKVSAGILPALSVKSLSSLAAIPAGRPTYTA